MTIRNRLNKKRPRTRKHSIVGNLLIAEYQVDKLRARLADLVYGYRPRMSNNNKASTHVFKHNNKWYKLSLRVDEVNVTSAAKDIVEQEFDY
jgi:hypothetical protein